MTGILILNLVFSTLVVFAIVGGLGWSIGSSRFSAKVGYAG
jgi:hypothetical protein